MYSLWREDVRSLQPLIRKPMQRSKPLKKLQVTDFVWYSIYMFFCPDDSKTVILGALLNGEGKRKRKKVGLVNPLRKRGSGRGKLSY